jgi:hypothetical protein
VLLEAESRAKLRDELLESGRPLTDPLLISVNFTTARSPNPDLEVASSNCALGRELLILHEHDLAGQEERTALDEARANLARAELNLLHWNRLRDGTSVFAPPAAPLAISPDEQTALFADAVAHHARDVAAKSEEITTCVPSAETVCGRSATRAPNPWLANGGQPCMGYTTHEALEGAYCAYWGSPASYRA